MGVFANGPDPTRVDVAGIAEAMRPALEMWFTAHLIIFDPKLNTSPRYDPIADSGGVPTQALVLDSGVDGALVQPIRSPTRIEAGGQGTAILGIRFQVKNVAVESGTKLRGGLRVGLLAGGNAPDLIGQPFELTEGIDSSLMWDHIYDAVLVTGG